MQTLQINRALKDQELAMKNIASSGSEINRNIGQLSKTNQEFSRAVEALMTALPDIRRVNAESEQSGQELLQMLNGNHEQK
jgi:methyl-accepting chemotaxis protein